MGSPGIRALSVWNPWAWALVAGFKTHENRDWRLPQRYVGTRVLVHCGAHKPSAHDIEQVEEVAEEAGIVMPEWARRPIRGIVGSVIFHCDEDPIQAASMWATGDRCWRVKPGSAVMFSAGLPCKGALGFFEPPSEVLARIAEAQCTTTR